MGNVEHLLHQGAVIEKLHFEGLVRRRPPLSQQNCDIDDSSRKSVESIESATVAPRMKATLTSPKPGSFRPKRQWNSATGISIVFFGWDFLGSLRRNHLRRAWSRFSCTMGCGGSLWKNLARNGVLPHKARRSSSDATTKRSRFTPRLGRRGTILPF